MMPQHTPHMSPWKFTLTWTLILIFCALFWSCVGLAIYKAAGG